jgi:hypothetical protein
MVAAPSQIYDRLTEGEAPIANDGISGPVLWFRRKIQPSQEWNWPRECIGQMRVAVP